MPFTWSRASSGQSLVGSGRFGLPLGDFPAGSTLERVIFGYSIRQTAFYGGRRGGPVSTHLRLGVIAAPLSSGVPNVDPGAPTTADWLWAGLINAEIVPLRQTIKEEYLFRWASPAEQLETVTRRKNNLAEPQRVYLVTSPIEERGSGFADWSATTYGSVLYSHLA